MARPMPPSAVLARFTYSFFWLRPKKSRAVLKEILPALGETMVPGCKDDAAGAARVARTGLRWRLHDKVHIDEPTARMHTAPSHGIYFRSTGSRFQRPAGPSDDLQHPVFNIYREVSFSVIKLGAEINQNW